MGPWPRQHSPRPPPSLPASLHERNIAPAGHSSAWLTSSVKEISPLLAQNGQNTALFGVQGRRIFSRHPTAPHAGAVFLSLLPLPYPTSATKFALLASSSALARQNSRSTRKTDQNQRFFASRANFVSVSPRIQTCWASFISPMSIHGFTPARRYAHSPNLARRALRQQRRWHTVHMTDAPTPRARTNEPAQASSLPSLAITGASGNVGGTTARLLSERGLPLRLLANTPSREVLVRGHPHDARRAGRR